MLTLVRAVLGLFGFLTGWFASYWFYFVRFDLADRPFLGRGAPFLVGVVAAVVVLVATMRLRHGFITTTVLGALLLGAIGFVAGFFGLALVGWLLDGDPTMAPMWGFVLGPLGFVLGGPLGALWWWQRTRPGRKDALQRS